MTKALQFISFGVSVAIILLMIPVASASVTGYSYMKEHKIGGSSDGAMEDYQMMFIVHRGDGTDDGRDLYLSNRSQNWPNDIRFENSSGADLDYWVESKNSTTAIVWVKVDHIPAATDTPGYATVRVFYGKAGDSGDSNGSATFPFFDDFSSFDNSKWNHGIGFNVKDGYGYLGSTVKRDNFVATKSWFDAPYALGYRVKSNIIGNMMQMSVTVHRQGNTRKVGGAPGYDLGDYGYCANDARPNNDTISMYRFDNTWTVLNNSNISLAGGVWYKGTIITRSDGLTASFYDDNMGPLNTAVTDDTTWTGGYIGLQNDGIVQDIYDYLYVRKYTKNEPTHGEWGTEQSPSPQPSPSPSPSPQPSQKKGPVCPVCPVCPTVTGLVFLSFLLVGISRLRGRKL